jgi:hypothetical protein
MKVVIVGRTSEVRGIRIEPGMRESSTQVRPDSSDVVAQVLNYTDFGNDDGADGNFWFKESGSKCRYRLHRAGKTDLDPNELTRTLLLAKLMQTAVITGSPFKGTLREIGVVDLDVLDPKNIKFQSAEGITVTQQVNQILFVSVGAEPDRLERGWSLIYSKYCSGKERPF